MIGSRPPSVAARNLFGGGANLLTESSSPQDFRSRCLFAHPLIISFLGFVNQLQTCHDHSLLRVLALANGSAAKCRVTTPLAPSSALSLSARATSLEILFCFVFHVKRLPWEGNPLELKFETQLPKHRHARTPRVLQGPAPL